MPIGSSVKLKTNISSYKFGIVTFISDYGRGACYFNPSLNSTSLRMDGGYWTNATFQGIILGLVSYDASNATFTLTDVTMQRVGGFTGNPPLADYQFGTPCTTKGVKSWIGLKSIIAFK